MGFSDKVSLFCQLIHVFLAPFLVGIVMNILCLFLSEGFIVMNGGEWLSMRSNLEMAGLIIANTFSATSILFVAAMLETPIYQKSHVNYRELLQLTKGWGNFISDRINIWRLLPNRIIRTLEETNFIDLVSFNINAILLSCIAFLVRVKYLTIFYLTGVKIMKRKEW